MPALTEKQMVKYFGNLEEHEYKHYNQAMGVWVEGKEHFKYLLRRGNYLPLDMAEGILESSTKNKRKDYVTTEKTKRFISNIRHKADKKGNIKFSGREIEYMQKDLGMNFSGAEHELNFKEEGIF